MSAPASFTLAGARVAPVARASSRSSGSRRRAELASSPRSLRPARILPGSRRSAAAARSVVVSASDAAEADVVIVGGGLAGLCAARTLADAGVDFLLLESSDAVGGRLQTDVVDGFLLDRGFAIFLTGYPEAQRVLDYDALDLRPFYAGADVRFEGAFHRVADPLRHPVDAVASLNPSHPIGTVLDKILVGVVRLQSLIGDTYDILTAPETTIRGRLDAAGFTESMTNRFFRPFMSGIFFNPELTTSSRLFNFVMRMLAVGQNCLPAKGIGEVCAQLERRLPAGSVRVNATAVGPVGPPNEKGARVVSLEGGDAVVAKRAVIVASAGPDADALLGDALASNPSATGAPVGTTCAYFAIDGPPPLPAPILYLNGDGDGLINNCCFPSTVSSTYAPAGKSLASVSVIGVPDMDDAELCAALKEELVGWFGEGARAWTPLRTYRIPFAQPNQTTPTTLDRDARLGGGLYVCGDHRSPATFDGAMMSGRKAAEAFIADRE